MPLLAEISPEGYAVIIGSACLGVGGIVTSVVTLVIGFLERGRAAERETARIEREAAAAREVKEVKTTLQESTARQDAKLDGIADVGVKAHTLANSETLARKKKYAEKCEAMAAVTGKPEDVREAELSRQEYEEHRKTHEVMEARDRDKTDIREALKAVPEKTAVKVVEKIKEEL